MAKSTKMPGRYSVRKLNGTKKVMRKYWDEERNMIAEEEVEVPQGFLVSFPAGHSIRVDSVDPTVLGPQEYGIEESIA